MKPKNEPAALKDLASIIFLALLTALMAFLYGRIKETRPEYADWDIWEYSRMAAAAPGLADDIPSPFAYRLLGPYLAGLLPFPDPQSFQLLSLLLSFVLILSFYALL